MDLVRQVEQALDVDGPLAQAIVGYLPRQGQLEMAREVAQTLESGGALVVEAGTGVGKTYAYLLPSILSGRRVLLSTATKALQDQLFRRDIPQLLRLFPTGLRVAMLKGRSSYLCLHRLQTARQDPICDDPAALRDMSAVETWAPFTRSGDLAELDTLDDDSPIIPLVTSTRENCLGSQCPQHRNCHVNQARRWAMESDLVVVNHHLFFADLNVRESGVAELLPSVHAVVFDEAHQLNEIGVQFLGQQVSTGQMQTLSRELLLLGLEQARGLADWAALAEQINQCAHALRSMVGVGRIGWYMDAPADVDAVRWGDALRRMLDALRLAHGAVSTVSTGSPELSAMESRVSEVQQRWEALLLAPPEGHTRWLEAGQSLRVVQTPLDIGASMRERVMGASTGAHQGKAWIFTSATLGHEPSLRWFVQSCGLQGAKVLQVESPFDFARQSSVYVPKEMAAPQSSMHSQAVAELVAHAAQMLGGRTLVLTTTLRAMRAIGESLRSSFNASEQQCPQVWVQGQAPKRKLMARFCNAAHSVRGGVLVASASFWEGVDIPGDALQLVVIDKLPFSPPDDPWLQARAQALEAEGKSAFMEMHLPQAAVMLKQGAGRLIRSETDRGILVVCDARLSTMGYGKRLMAALPPMRRIQDNAEFLEALQLLTTTSTKDLPWS